MRLENTYLWATNQMLAKDVGSSTSWTALTSYITWSCNTVWPWRRLPMPQHLPPQVWINLQLVRMTSHSYCVTLNHLVVCWQLQHVSNDTCHIFTVDCSFYNRVLQEGLLTLMTLMITLYPIWVAFERNSDSSTAEQDRSCCAKATDCLSR